MPAKAGYVLKPASYIRLNPTVRRSRLSPGDMLRWRLHPSASYTADTIDIAQQPDFSTPLRFARNDIGGMATLHPKRQKTPIVLPGSMMLCGWIIIVCIIIAGSKLAHYRAWTYCLVIAGAECIFMPFGTVLGVFTIVVLMKDSVKGLFAGNQPFQQ